MGAHTKSDEGKIAAQRGDGNGPELSAIGLEAEFALLVDGVPVNVEEVFRDPRDFLGDTLVHRTGTSFHVRTGGAVYFDTGVIEVATPLIEVERGCGARAGRSLWESLVAVSDGLARWEASSGRRAALAGFSAHYNVSCRQSDERPGRTLDDLALLLAYILPPPVMVLAANRSSTGIGVRPRRTRIEVTADFTPSAPLVIATATLITGIVRSVLQWPSFRLDVLDERGLPTIRGFRPIPHTTRRGWLARGECYPQNPFITPIDDAVWPVRLAAGDGPNVTERMSLRHIAQRVFHRFRWSIGRVAEPLTMRLIAAVVAGRAPSLLDLPQRPPAYEDVGRLCRWDETVGAGMARSRYERVLIRALSGTPLRIGTQVLRPIRTQGWTHVVFRREHDGARRTMSLDALLPYLDAWDSAPVRGSAG